MFFSAVEGFLVIDITDGFGCGVYVLRFPQTTCESNSRGSYGMSLSLDFLTLCFVALVASVYSRRHELAVG